MTRLFTVSVRNGVATMSPVHPLDDIHRLLNDLMEVIGTGKFLPYDKDRAWGGRKTGQIHTDSITKGSGYALVPVLNQRGRGSIEVFCCGNFESGMVPGLDAAAKLAADHGVVAARLKWFSHEMDEHADHAVRLQLKEFTSTTEPCRDSRTPAARSATSRRTRHIRGLRRGSR